MCIRPRYVCFYQALAGVHVHMRYVAEVLVAGSDLTEHMGRMRSWLDHRSCEPHGFRLQGAGQQRRLRVSFKQEREAAAFAEKFGGTVLPLADTDAVLT